MVERGTEPKPEEGRAECGAMRGTTRECGFTLLELLAVVVVLALIAGVAVPRYLDVSARARQSAEDGVVGAVRSAIRSRMVNNAVMGNPGAPASLDAAASGAVASASAPFFAAVLQSPVMDGWRKGATANEYVGPAGTKYFYDPPTGQFATEIAVVAGSGPGTSGSSPAIELTNATSWTAGSGPVLGAGRLVGAGYSMSGSEVMLDDAGGFSEAARRTLIAGTAIAAGTFTLQLDTALTNYWNQLNYWQVYAVKNGTTLNLTGNNLNWGTAPAGTKLLTQDYAPEMKDGGGWYTYSNSFTVSAADATGYDQIVVIMAGTRFAGQVLGWRGVSITPP